MEPEASGGNLLVAGSPFDLRAYYTSLRERPACRELLEVLRTGVPAPWSSAEGGCDWTTELADPTFVHQFTAAMDSRARLLAPAMARALADLPVRRVLDIAGGSGMYATALVDAHPDRSATVVERVPVDTVTRALLATRGYADQVQVVAGDTPERRHSVRRGGGSPVSRRRVRPHQGWPP